METVHYLSTPVLIATSVILAIGSALFSGLTLGMMTLDVLYLQVSTTITGKSGLSKRKSKYARRLLPLRRDGNLLLVTLLFGNVTVNAGFSILVSELTSGWLGFAISTLLIMIFGEIIPQAICAKYGLLIGGFFSPLIRIIQLILFPLIKPIAYILDNTVGYHGEIYYKRDELKNFLEYHARGKIISMYELFLMESILLAGKQYISTIMLPISKCVFYNVNDSINMELVNKYIYNGITELIIMGTTKTKQLSLSYSINSGHNSCSLIVQDEQENIVSKELLQGERNLTNETLSYNLMKYNSNNTIDEDIEFKLDNNFRILNENTVIIGFLDLTKLINLKEDKYRIYQDNRKCEYEIRKLINRECFKKLSNILISDESVSNIERLNSISLITNSETLQNKVLCIDGKICIATLLSLLSYIPINKVGSMLIYSSDNSSIHYEGIITSKELLQFIVNKGKKYENLLDSSEYIEEEVMCLNCISNIKMTNYQIESGYDSETNRMTPELENFKTEKKRNSQYVIDFSESRSTTSQSKKEKLESSYQKSIGCVQNNSIEI
ncbi:uncharacterized protein CMU_042840 [Cryptosporidium muris RN66]|uniref:CNNM transmembrane domain-containing protein n=1 Tax=Cryptosporidium muris (strain RN66) TaxID=441375 RepID=B6AAG9_CRYMR|nr:uncharacterized protein CMU_042840 [Cryptosporidium muris RN66]EEA05210.1 hypothetical protein, conserved [Cryptosporidium muris RN66]|eukprot:XP_002139559.1 hypothetical protein [Cryptosporidium muris RN66]